MVEMELDLMVNSTPAVITNNLDDLKARITTALASYQSRPVSADTLSDAKKSLADLRKVQAVFEAKRIAIKNETMRPYLEFEEKYRDALEALTSLIGGMDAQVKGVEAELEKQKRSDIEEIIDERIGSQPQSVWEFSKLSWFYNTKWMNKSYTLQKIAEEVDSKIAEISQALSVLANHSHTAQLLGRYKQTGSLGDALTYETELIRDEESAERLRKEQEAATAAQGKATGPVPVPAPAATAPAEPAPRKPEPIRTDTVGTIPVERPADATADKVITYGMEITAPVYVIASVKRWLVANGWKAGRVER